MYVKTSNGVAEKYPYTIANLRSDNPNTSFPKSPSDEMMAEWGVHRVTMAEQPATDQRTQYIGPSQDPELIDGVWTIGWVVIDKTQDEIDAFDEGMADINRNERHKRMTETDWWALPDSPTMTAEQTAYRQALRDITSHANWPHLEEADWPTKP
jgi:hypothetical protein